MRFFNLLIKVLTIHCILFSYATLPSGFAETLPSDTSVVSLKKFINEPVPALLDRVVVIAADSGYEPFTMLNNKGQPAGLYVDIWNLWAKKTNYKVKFLMTSWAQTLQNVKDQKADIHCGLFFSEDRAAYLDYSQSFYFAETYLFFHRKFGPRTTLNQLIGHKIAVETGDYAAEFLRDQITAADVIEFNVNEYDDILNRMANGEIHALAGDKLPTYSLLGHRGFLGEFVASQEKLYSRPIFSAVKKGNSALLAVINEGLSAITSDEMAELESRWIINPTARLFKTQTSSLQFTMAEQAWLQKHKKVRLGVYTDRYPFEYVGSEGQYTGMISDYLRILEARIGIQMQIEKEPDNSKIISGIKNRQIDATPFAITNSKSNSRLLYSQPYLSFPIVIINRDNSPFIEGPWDLKEQQVVATTEDDSYYYLLQKYPMIKLKLMNSQFEALDAVSAGRSDAYVGSFVVASNIIMDKGLSNLKVAAPVDYNIPGVVFAIRSDWPELVEIMNKGLNSITATEHNQIRNKWISIRFEHMSEQTYFRRLVLKIGGIVIIPLIVLILWNRQIRRREERYKGFTEHGMDIVIAISENGIIKYQSPSLSMIFEYSAKELIGKSVTQLFHAEDQIAWQKVFALLLSGSEPQSLILRIRHQNGTYQYVESDCINLLNNQAVKAVVVNSREITERIQAEKRIKESEKRYRLLAENSVDVIFVMDMEYKTTFVSPSVERLTGYTPDEQMSFTLEQQFSRVSSDFIKKFMKQRKLSEPTEGPKTVSTRFELELKRKNGSTVWTEVNTNRLVDGKQNVIGILGIIRDISDRKVIEKALKDAHHAMEERVVARTKELVDANTQLKIKIEELQQAVKAKEVAENELKAQRLLTMRTDRLRSLGEMAAGIAHEINQPLSVISLGIDNLLNKALTKRLDERYIENKCDHLFESIDRIRKIIEHVRIFSREQESENIKKVNIGDAIMDSLLLVKTQYRYHNVDIKLDLDNKAGFFYGNNFKFEQVLLNLLSNAKDAVEDRKLNEGDAFQKQIIIRTRGDQRMVHLELQDNGIGIDESDLKNIFTPFFTLKGPDRGTGLGLSISYGIVKEMGGEISVESKVNNYTVMRLSFPKNIYQYKNQI
jgi:PAS domain S-box-containing protein